MRLHHAIAEWHDAFLGIIDFVYYQTNKEIKRSLEYGETQKQTQTYTD